MASYAPESAPISPLPLDPEALQVIRSCADRLAHLADDFIGWLHQDITALIPNVVVSMADHGWPFCERMAQATLWVALADEPSALVADVLRRAGADNWREGFPDAEYVSVAHALVRTIRGLSENEWSTSMGSAWISCFQWMRPHLLAGARQAAAEPGAAQEQHGPAESQQHDQRPMSNGRAHQVPADGTADDIDLESVADLLDEDNDEVGYGQIMLSMTLNSRRDRSQDE